MAVPTPLRLAAFGGALALVFGASLVVGATAAPFDRGSEDHLSGAMPMGGDAATTTAQPVGGLAVAEAGYTLVPAERTLPRRADVPFTFAVTGPDGSPETEFTPTHTKELHLIVVRRDLTGFQHLHPRRAADGTWTVPLDLRAAGTYRVFADFQPTALGRPLALGVDVQVAGRFRPTVLPRPTGTGSADGYRVRVSGEPVVGQESELTFTVERDGEPVSDLQPYLGAFGHLVALRAGDLAYLHTHPAQDARPGGRGGPEVVFATAFPSAGSYRLFLSFAAGGSVHDVPFTLEVGGAAGAGPASTPSAPPGGGSPHTD